MFGFKTFTAGLVLGMGGAMFVSHYHVVHTHQGVVVVPRTQKPPLRSSYVDIRTWGEAMWVNHPEVTEALQADGRTSLIGEAVSQNRLQGLPPEPSANPSLPRNVAVSNEEAYRVGQYDDMIVPAPRKRPAPGTVPIAVAPPSPFDPADLALDQFTSPKGDAAPGHSLDQGTAQIRVPEMPMEESSPVIPRGTRNDIAPPRYTAPANLQQTSAEARSRELIRQLIPPTRQPSRGATPLRDLTQDWFSAPAPGSNRSGQTNSLFHESRVDGLDLQ